MIHRNLLVFLLFAFGYFLSACSGPNSLRAVFLADRDRDNVYELYRNEENVEERGITPIVKISNQGDLRPSVGFFNPYQFLVYKTSPDSRFVAYVASDIHIAAASSDGEAVLGNSVRTIASGAVPRWSPNSRYLAYIVGRQLYVANFDSTGQHRVSARNIRLTEGFGPASVSVPLFNWLPDSEKIVYVSQAPHAIYSINRNGTGETRLNTVETLTFGTEYIYQGTAGGRIIYAKISELSDTPNEYYSILPDGSSRVRLFTVSQPPYRKIILRIAPNRSRIAFVTDNEVDDQFELYTILPDGSDIRKVSGPIVRNGNVEAFLWSPDSSKIAFRGDLSRDDVTRLYSTTPFGGTRRNISVDDPLTANVGQFNWSPDNRKIFYTSNKSLTDYHDLYVADALRSSTHLRLTQLNRTNHKQIQWVKWSPDSRSIGYVLTNKDFITTIVRSPSDIINPENILYVANATTGTSQRISKDGVGVHFDRQSFIYQNIAWSRDSDQIAYLAFQHEDYIPRGNLKIRLLSSKLDGEIDDISGLLAAYSDVFYFRLVQPRLIDIFLNERDWHRFTPLPGDSFLPRP